MSDIERRKELTTSLGKGAGASQGAIAVAGCLTGGGLRMSSLLACLPRAFPSLPFPSLPNKECGRKEFAVSAFPVVLHSQSHFFASAPHVSSSLPPSCLAAVLQILRESRSPGAIGDTQNTAHNRPFHPPVDHVSSLFIRIPVAIGFGTSAISASRSLFFHSSTQHSIHGITASTCLHILRHPTLPGPLLAYIQPLARVGTWLRCSSRDAARQTHTSTPSSASIPHPNTYTHIHIHTQ
ncbi:hypothetical protein RB213_005557 [Colletotrichum asianum]